MDPVIAQISTQAATILMQNTASIVASKVQAIKAQKNDKQAVDQLTEIINDLVSENSELQSLAQAYKQELVAQQVTEEDISYITETVIPLSKEFMAASNSPVPEDVLSVVEKLLSVESLKVLQLLGFNFKEAIGAPLTDLLARAIAGAGPASKELTEQVQLGSIELQRNLTQIALDPDSFDRYCRIVGQ